MTTSAMHMPGESAHEYGQPQGIGRLLDEAPCGFISFGDDGRILLTNTTLRSILGFAPGDLEGRHMETLLTPGSRIFYQTHWFPLLRLHGGAEEIFLLLRSAAGEEVGVLANAVRRLRNGRSAYDCVLVRVRERQKYEEELLRARRTAEQALRELQEKSVALQDANELLSEQNVELEAQQQMLQDQAGELAEAGEELRVANEDLQARAEELERLRAEADEANQAKSAFLAVMSHELRTPLNAIAGYVDLLDMEIQGPLTPEQREYVARVRRSQLHLLRLINDMLNLARIEAGRVDYDIVPVRVADVLEDVRPMVEPQLTARQITFNAAMPREHVVLADRDKLQQVLLNLLGNAVKFTPPGGRVEAISEPGPAGDTFLLSVRDTGIGIPAARLQSVFDPFVQVDVSRTSRKEGTGLGLAISRDLARGMGGELRATSTEGSGSCFTLELPRAES